MMQLESEGEVMYDSYLDCEVLVVAPLLGFIGDNPCASEILNHLRGTPSKFCRICMVDMQKTLKTKLPSFVIQADPTGTSAGNTQI